MALLSNNNAFQSAWVVADFDEAIKFWANTFGVGPFYALDYKSGPELVYRGEPGELEMKVAWAQAGDMQVELIHPTSESPNVYRDLVPAGVTQFHHICYWSDDIAADTAVLTQAGHQCAMASGPGATQFAYFDTSSINGHMIELLERLEGMAGIFDAIKSIASTWDGERPAREFAELLG